MIKTGKRVLAFAMILSLALGLGVPALAAASQVSSISADLESVYVGQSIDTITLTATGGNFKSGAENSAFTVEGCGANITVGSVDATGNDQATLHVTTTTAPQTAGTLTITATSDAFDESSTPAEGPLTTTIEVKQASGTVSARLEGGDLYAGTPVSGQTIVLTATTENGLSFKSSFDSEVGTYFTLGGAGADGLGITSAESSGSTATLTLNGTPGQAGDLTVTAKTEAFTYPPEGDKSDIEVTTVNAAPSITASVSGSPLTHGAEGTFTVTVVGGVFADDIQNHADYFTLTGGAPTNPTTVQRNGDTQVTLTVTPSSQTPIQVQSIRKDAFKYKPASDLSSVDGRVTVSAPTGSIKATLNNGPLYAGTQVDDQTITLKTTGLTFADDPFTEVSTYFSLSGEAANGLNIASASKSGSDVTLNLSGTPQTSGQVTVTAKQAAFTYPPASDQSDSSSITVTAAPEVTLAPDTSVTVTAGDSTQVAVKITSPDYVKFVNPAVTDNFGVSDAGFSGTVSGVQISEDGKTATLTLSAAPTTTDSLTVTVQPAAFTPVASGAADATVEVKAPSGPITATQNGTLTAGQAAENVTVGLTITGTLNFKSGLSAADFTLDNAGGLQITNVEGSGKNVTLTLTGTPKAGGDYKVKVNTSAFTVKPDLDTPVEATAKEPNNLTIGYPNITLTKDHDHIAEGDENVTITLTSDNSPFNAISDTSLFSITSETEGLAAEVTLTGAAAAAGENQVVLTLTNKTDKTGTLKITALPQAFQYQPQAAVTVEITVGPPEGKLAATLDGELHVGTPVEGQTITVEITESHGLHFKEDAGKNDYKLDGTGAAGLEISDVIDNGDSVTLQLDGTPTTEGDFTVKAETSAFRLPPDAEVEVTGTFTVQAAPEGTVMASLDGTLNAGTAVSGQTITVQAEGLTFKSELAEDLFTLGTGSEGLTVTGVTVDDTGKQATLALTGTPAKAGTFTVTVAQSAFQFWPEAETLDAGTVDIGAAIVSLAVVENTLTAGTEGGSFKLTATGSTFVDDVTDLVSMAQGTAQGEMKLVSAQVQEGAVVVTLSGTPATQGTIALTVSKDAFAPAPAEDVTLDVTVAPGQFTTDTQVESGAPSMTLGTPDEQLASAVLTEEEKALQEAGAKVVIQLEEQNINSSVSAADKAAVAAAAEGYTAGDYLDVSLYKQINNGDRTPVTATNGTIRVVFTIPESLRAQGREFAVVRVHDGVGAVLEDKDSAADTITVDTNLFSTYAIVYRDPVTPTQTPAPTETPVPTETPAPTETPVPTETPAPTEAPEVTEAPDVPENPVATSEPFVPGQTTATPAPTGTAPDTGDGSQIALWLSVLALCGAGLAATVLVRRRRDSRG